MGVPAIHVRAPFEFTHGADVGPIRYAELGRKSQGDVTVVGDLGSGTLKTSDTERIEQVRPITLLGSSPQGNVEQRARAAVLIALAFRKSCATRAG